MKKYIFRSRINGLDFSPIEVIKNRRSGGFLLGIFLDDQGITSQRTRVQIHSHPIGLGSEKP